jgi:hypothetical protein
MIESGMTLNVTVYDSIVCLFLVTIQKICHWSQGCVGPLQQSFRIAEKIPQKKPKQTGVWRAEGGSGNLYLDNNQ